MSWSLEKKKFNDSLRARCHGKLEGRGEVGQTIAEKKMGIVKCDSFGPDKKKCINTAYIFYIFFLFRFDPLSAYSFLHHIKKIHKNV